MQKFTKLTSIVMPLPIKDIDTDMIIPADFLTSTSREGYGENVFQRLRDQDADFPMNQEKYKKAQIIVADTNFGCGSSREHAVWAILSAGFSVIIAPSFADIFFNNSAKNGLVLITLDKQIVDKLMKSSELRTQNSDGMITVDLENQTVQTAFGSYNFDFDPFRKHCILNGLDDIDYILEEKDAIEKWEQCI